MNKVAFPPRSASELVSLLEHLLGVFSAAEIALALLVLVLSLTVPQLGARVFESFERRLGSLAHHPGRQLIAVGMMAVAVRALMLPWLGVPEPLVHDETSILLQAQTFAAGRLANPTHPFWQHFETIYVNQLPSYASMYFPGRGAPLAAGLVVANSAWLGVWMSMVLLCMGATWMLQGWVSLPMALLGGMLVALRLGMFSFWINSYYGGAFIALGAMLVIGALPRILDQRRWRFGLVMGLGAVILMTSRPYEGALLCAPVAVVMLAGLYRQRRQEGDWQIAKAAFSALLLVGAGAAFLLQYNVATTGNALKTPYELNRATYAAAPAFLTAAPLASLKQGPAHFQKYFSIEAQGYQARYSPLQLLRSVLAKLFYSWNFYIGAILSTAFFCGLWACRRDAFLWGGSAFFFVGYFLETWNFPQYTAPVYPLLLIFMMRGFDWLRRPQGRRQPMRLFLSRAMPLASVAVLALPVTSYILGWTSLHGNSIQAVCCTEPYDTVRPALRKQLLGSPGPDLVLVKNTMRNPTEYELVNNEPDIDRAPIVWAHRLGPAQDERLQAYFADRRVWEFEWLPDTEPGYRLTLLRDRRSAP